ncbi:hypothetical protein DCC62_32555 [candidate division KSB1 bacterium]|nr:MAG: hypothetical protein DCC62_32555 [candidate division KSB1 bacterium]
MADKRRFHAIPFHPSLRYRPGGVSQVEFAAINMAPLAEFDESSPRKGAVLAVKGRFRPIPIHPKLSNSIPAKACCRPGGASQDKFAAINTAPLAEFDESRPRKSAVLAVKGRFRPIPFYPKLSKKYTRKAMRMRQVALCRHFTCSRTATQAKSLLMIS